MLPHDEIYHYGIKGMAWGKKKGEFSADKDITRLTKELGNKNRSLDSIVNEFSKKLGVGNVHELKNKVSPFIWARFEAALKKRERLEIARDPANIRPKY